MAKSLTFEFEGKEYKLEFTRRSVENMERRGFVASDITEKPMTTLPALFKGAFFAHHRNLREDVIERIFAKMTNKQELIGKLAEMYNEPISAMIDEPEEDAGNVNWKASW